MDVYYVEHIHLPLFTVSVMYIEVILKNLKKGLKIGTKPC